MAKNSNYDDTLPLKYLIDNKEEPDLRDMFFNYVSEKYKNNYEQFILDILNDDSIENPNIVSLIADVITTISVNELIPKQKGLDEITDIAKKFIDKLSNIRAAEKISQTNKITKDNLTKILNDDNKFNDIIEVLNIGLNIINSNVNHQPQTESNIAEIITKNILRGLYSDNSQIAHDKTRKIADSINTILSQYPQDIINLISSDSHLLTIFIDNLNLQEPIELAFINRQYKINDSSLKKIQEEIGKSIEMIKTQITETSFITNLVKDDGVLSNTIDRAQKGEKTFVGRICAVVFLKEMKRNPILSNIIESLDYKTAKYLYNNRENLSNLDLNKILPNNQDIKTIDSNIVNSKLFKYLETLPAKTQFETNVKSLSNKISFAKNILEFDANIADYHRKGKFKSNITTIGYDDVEINDIYSLSDREENLIRTFSQVTFLKDFKISNSTLNNISYQGHTVFEGNVLIEESTINTLSYESWATYFKKDLIFQRSTLDNISFNKCSYTNIIFSNSSINKMQLSGKFFHYPEGANKNHLTIENCTIKNSDFSELDFGYCSSINIGKNVRMDAISYNSFKKNLLINKKNLLINREYFNDEQINNIHNNIIIDDEIYIDDITYDQENKVLTINHSDTEQIIIDLYKTKISNEFYQSIKDFYFSNHKEIETIIDNNINVVDKDGNIILTNSNDIIIEKLNIKTISKIIHDQKENILTIINNDGSESSINLKNKINDELNTKLSEIYSQCIKGKKVQDIDGNIIYQNDQIIDRIMDKINDPSNQITGLNDYQDGTLTVILNPIKPQEFSINLKNEMSVKSRNNLSTILEKCVTDKVINNYMSEKIKGRLNKKEENSINLSDIDVTKAQISYANKIVTIQVIDTDTTNKKRKVSQAPIKIDLNSTIDGSLSTQLLEFIEKKIASFTEDKPAAKSILNKIQKEISTSQADRIRTQQENNQQTQR